MKTIKSLLLGIVSLCTLSIVIGKAEATPLIGGMTDYFHSFTGSLDSVVNYLTSLGFG